MSQQTDSALNIPEIMKCIQSSAINARVNTFSTFARLTPFKDSTANFTSVNRPVAVNAASRTSKLSTMLRLYPWAGECIETKLFHTYSWSNSYAC